MKVIKYLALPLDLMLMGSHTSECITLSNSDFLFDDLRNGACHLLSYANLVIDVFYRLFEIHSTYCSAFMALRKK